MRHRLSLGRRAALAARPAATLAGWAVRRYRGRPRGQSLVELALILPLLMLLFAGALDLGRVFYSQITIENAAKEGALEASRNPSSFDNTRPCDTETNRVLCLVLNEAKGSLYEITAADVTMSCSPDPCPANPAFGDTVTVTVAGHFTLLTPLLAQVVGPTVTLSASSTAQLGIEPDPGVGPTPSPSPSPSPTAAPTPTPTPDPSASPTAEPTPTPTPVCVAPSVSGGVSANPTSGTSVKGGTGTVFTFTAPTVAPQPGCAITYTWSFGDGANGSGETVTHVYQNKGSGENKSYTVSLAISVYLVPQTWTGTVDVVVNP
jgi:Flp pilus assembly protein TadG